ncbi:MAG: hypothetical protein AVDCRST_MAG54-660 [uncultured Actinomycetospora sp.]|uniref:Uncharacterized protein n=1 Tax=uncultured Actinomycetospora sp. TaxID=1135996 RepID=A0A6J4HIK3_9PSEU|nr:MAG: hypothetical protein AVDCRST_MAG54-660 [uncultured Actinomycetospora sp.]
MVRAAAQQGVGVAVGALHVEHLGGVDTATGDEEAPALEVDLAPVRREGLEQLGEAGAERLPVEGRVERGVVDADAAADVDHLGAQAEALLPVQDDVPVVPEHREVGGGGEVVRQGVQVEAGEAQAGQGRRGVDGGGQVGLVDPELRGAPGHRQRRRGERAGEVDAQEDLGGRPRASCLVGEAVQAQHALDVEAGDAGGETGGELVVGRHRPAHEHRGVRGGVAHGRELPAGRDLEPGDDPVERGDHALVGVGLHRVEHAAPVGQGGDDLGRVAPQLGEVVGEQAHRLAGVDGGGDDLAM